MKKHVIYTSYFEVPKQFATSNGRLKLADFGNLISETCIKALDATTHIYEMHTEVSEVIKTNCRQSNERIYDSNIRTYAKVVVDMEVEKFPHVRRIVLKRFANQAVNYMPKVAFEEVVFRFFHELGYALHEVYEDSIRVTVQDGSYREDLIYIIRPDTEFHSPKNIFEYKRSMDERFGMKPVDFD